MPAKSDNKSESLFIPEKFWEVMKSQTKDERLTNDISKASTEELKIIAELLVDEANRQQKKEDDEKQAYSKLEKMAEAYVLQNKPALAKMNILAIKYWNKFVVKNKFFEKTLDLLKKGLAKAGGFLMDLLKGALFLALFDPKGELASQLIDMITNLVIWFIDLLMQFIPRFLDALFIAFPRIAKALFNAFLKVSAKIGELIFKIFSGVLKRLGLDIGPVSENMKKGVGTLTLGALILSKMGLLTPLLGLLSTTLSILGKQLLKVSTDAEGAKQFTGLLPKIWGWVKIIGIALWGMISPLITAIIPFLPVILAVVAAVAALTLIFIYAEEIVAWFEGLWKSFWDWFDTLGTVGKTIVGALVVAIASIFFPITLLIGLIYGLAKAFKWLKEVDWSGLWTGLMTGLMTGLSDAWTSTLSYMADAVKNLFLKFDKWVKTSKLRAFFTKIGKFLSKLPEYFDWLLHADWSDVGNVLSSMFKMSLEYLKENFEDFIDLALAGLTTMWNDMVEGTKRKLRGIGKTISDFFTPEGFRAVMTTMLESVFGPEFTNRLYRGIRDAFQLVMNFINGFLNSMYGLIYGLTNMVSLSLPGAVNPYDVSLAQGMKASGYSRKSGVEQLKATAIIRASELEESKAKTALTTAEVTRNEIEAVIAASGQMGNERLTQEQIRILRNIESNLQQGPRVITPAASN